MDSIQSRTKKRSDHQPRVRPLVALIAAPVVLGGCCTDCGPPGDPYDVTTAVTAADMNGDGYDDLAVAGYRYDEMGPSATWLAVFAQNPASPGVFTTTSNLTIGPGVEFGKLAVADLDGVNGPDVLMTRAVPNTIAVALQATGGGGRLQAPLNVDVGPSPMNIAVGDLNNDGAPDMVVVDGRRPQGGIKIVRHNNQAPGSFLPAVDIAFNRVVTAVAIGDIDGDGRVDLAAATWSNFQGSNGTGYVSIMFADANNVGAFLPRVDFPAGSEPSSLRIADIDRDGRVDVVVTNANTYTGVGNAGISVLLQDPNVPRTLLAPVHYDVPPLVTEMSVADLDGDSWLDLALAAHGGLTVLLQDPAHPGTYLPTAKNYPVDVLSSGVTVGRLNGDALPDVALAFYRGTAVFFNDPATPGSFLAPVILNR